MLAIHFELVFDDDGWNDCNKFVSVGHSHSILLFNFAMEPVGFSEIQLSRCADRCHRQMSRCLEHGVEH